MPLDSYRESKERAADAHLVADSPPTVGAMISRIIDLTAPQPGERADNTRCAEVHDLAQQVERVLQLALHPPKSTARLSGPKASYRSGVRAALGRRTP